MDRDFGISGALLLLILAAVFYPPIATLLGDALRSLLQLGAVGGGLYLALRHPWDALYIAAAGAVLFAAIASGVSAAPTSGPFLGMVTFFAVFFFLTFVVLHPLQAWTEKQKKR